MLFVALSGMILFSFSGCSEKIKNPATISPTIPVLTTASVSSVEYTRAVCGGNVTSDGGEAVTARGVCWSLSPDPKITDQHTEDGIGQGVFTSQMTALIADTLYYVRAYATNIKGTGYGNVQIFRTLKMVVDVVSDIDGNQYPVVKIGEQYWLQENLRVTRYRNGDPVPVVTADAQWKNLTNGAMCIFDNLAGNDTVYGNLYNWHALNDNRGLCPVGWHVPSDMEWGKLVSFLGGNMTAGGKLKSEGTIEQGTGLWFFPNKAATNSSGFTGLPGGYRINYGTFYSLGNVAYFWSSSDTASVNAWHFILDANNADLKRYFSFKTNGYSVRCCKD